MKSYLLSGALLFIISGCSSFQAERVDSQTSDKKALSITDEWVQKDTENVIREIVAKMTRHQGFRNYRKKYNGRIPRIFVGEIQNQTSEAYFPIQEINDELLDRFSAGGNFVLVDSAKREDLLREITYQQDGMVAPNTAKQVGKQTGADIIVFGNVYMKVARRKGKSIRQYSVNIRMTDIETGEEVMRVRAKLSKYSQQKKFGW